MLGGPSFLLGSIPSFLETRGAEDPVTPKGSGDRCPKARPMRPPNSVDRSQDGRWLRDRDAKAVGGDHRAEAFKVHLGSRRTHDPLFTK